MAIRKWFVYYVLIGILNVTSTFAETTVARSTTPSVPTTTAPTTVLVTTRRMAPERVTGLKGVGQTSTTITIEWSASNRADNYSVDYLLVNKFQCGNIDGQRTHFGVVTELSVVLEDLFSFSEYRIFVSAVNELGMSEESSIPVTTQYEPPITITPLGAMLSSITATSLSFTWNPASCEEYRHPIFAYEVVLTSVGLELPPMDMFLPENTAATTFSDLIPCRSYSFTVRPELLFVDGAIYSSPVTAETKPSVPGKVSNLTVISTSNRTDLMWQQPDEESDCLTDYLVEYRLLQIGQCHVVNNSQFMIGPPITSELYASIYRLLAYSTYQVRVKARYNTISGRSYTTRTDTLAQAPSGTPFNITLVNKTSTSLYYEFEEVPCEGRNGVITGYTCVIENPGFAPQESRVSTRRIIFTDLSPGTEYSVRIAAANSEIDAIGPFSDSIYDVTDNEPGGNSNALIGGLVSGLILAVIIVAVIIIAHRNGWIEHVKGRNKPRRKPSNDKMQQNSNGAGVPLPTISSAAFHNTRFISDDDIVYEVPVPRKPAAPTLPRKPKRGIVPWAYFDVSEQELGKGAFGKVYAGHVWSDRLQEWKPGAIKVLKAGAPPQEEKAFHEEFKTMQRISYHRNVVSLLAAATNNEGVLHVGIEFAQHGNLRKYLRDYRKAGKSIHHYTPPQTADGDEVLTLTTILRLAHEVIQGMLHLLDKQIIHRDLAARNVLLGDEGGLKVAKVSDFGLARDVDYGKAHTRVKLPTRWLAIESIRFRKFSTESDVWAYGILLYEMITLGIKPYPGIENADIIGRLEEGYRMEQPNGCDDEIYNLMTCCWQREPSMRPTFAELEKIVRQKMNKDDVIYANT